MILYIDSHALSPYAMSAYVALREKGIPFETRLVNLQQAEHRLPGFSAISRTQRVPTMDDHGFHLAESSAICEYIDEHYPGPPLYPAALQSRAKAREIQAWLRSDLAALREERSTEHVFLTRHAPPLSPRAQQAADKLFHTASQLLQPGQPTLFDAWCIADTDLALMLNRLVFAGNTVPAMLAEYARQQWQRPAVQAWATLSRPVT